MFLSLEYNSAFEEEAVQHSSERSGADGGRFESGMETKAIPGMTVILHLFDFTVCVDFITVDTTLVVDDRYCPVMDNSETTIHCEETQSPLNFTVIYGHEYRRNGETLYINIDIYIQGRIQDLM